MVLSQFFFGAEPGKKRGEKKTVTAAVRVFFRSKTPGENAEKKTVTAPNGAVTVFSKQNSVETKCDSSFFFLKKKLVQSQFFFSEAVQF